MRGRASRPLSSANGGGVTVNSDLRRAKRRRVLMTATVISTECVQRARIRDLTSTGAGITCDTPLERASDVILKRGDLFIAARVAWVDRHAAGLEFYRPIALDELAASFMLS
jgi:hypothetical protein